MKRLGRRAGRAALAAFTLLAVVACSNGDAVVGTMQCKPCPGNYLDPNGVIGPHDQVASIRVCIDSVCRTEHYTESQRSHRSYYSVTGINPPNRQRIERIEVTTLNARNKVIRLETGTSIDLPAIKHTDIHSCRCTGFEFAYDNQGGRFVVTTQ